jgi:hypothetical protein
MKLMNSNSKSPVIILFTIAVSTGLLLVAFSQSVYAAVGISINYGQNIFNDGHDGFKGGKWDSKQQESGGTDCSKKSALVEKHTDSLHDGNFGEIDKIMPTIPSIGTDAIMDCVP